jgi:cytochrome d ubiquinol oxidase subunit II
MTYQLLGITVLWIFLFGYMIVASIDFGAGFFSYYSTITGKKSVIHGIIDRYLSPVWEVTNVFLIFFMVGMVGFFPDAAYYYGTALLLPYAALITPLAIMEEPKKIDFTCCYMEPADCSFLHRFPLC